MGALIAILLLLLTASVQAADRYWTNDVNLTPYVAGDTVHFYGTIATNLTITNNGTAGNPITFSFEDGAKFSVPSLPDLDIQRSFFYINQSYITIDGNETGTIECTDNGTLLGSQISNNGIEIGTDAQHVTIQNLIITNMYVREPFGSDPNRFGVAINMTCGSDITVYNCSLSQGDTMIAVYYPPGVHSNIMIMDNYISICNHGIAPNTYLADAFLYNIDIASNRIDHMENWDNQISPSPIHLDGIYFWNEALDLSGGFSNVLVHHNFIGPSISHYWPPSTTAAIHASMYNPNQMVSAKVYNNIIITGANAQWNNPVIGGFGYGALVANNTIFGTNASGIRGYTNSWVINNLCYGAGNGIAEPIMHNMGNQNLSVYHYSHSDFNCYWGTPTVNPAFISYNTSGTPDPPFQAEELVTGQTSGATGKFFYRDTGDGDLEFRWTAGFSNGETVVGGTSGASAVISNGHELSEATGVPWNTWKTGTTNDIYSTTNQPALNLTTYAPLTNDTVLIGKGSNLTEFGITSDYAGNPRPATGPWTIGAYEVAGEQVADANFTGTPTSGLAPLTVNFTDASTLATNWSWDFGDEGTSTAQNPSHEYASAGTYTVTLTINAGEDTLQRTDYITVTSASTGAGTWNAVNARVGTIRAP